MSRRIQLAEANDFGYKNCVHKHLRRLERIWIDYPIFFVTACTFRRKPLLAQTAVAEILVDEWKSWTSRRIRLLRPRPTTAATTLWQREYFDHVLRSGESYSQKWDYVRENPVPVGLVRSSNDWPYSGRVESSEHWP